MDETDPIRRVSVVSTGIPDTARIDTIPAEAPPEPRTL